MVDNGNGGEDSVEGDNGRGELPFFERKAERGEVSSLLLDSSLEEIGEEGGEEDTLLLFFLLSFVSVRSMDEEEMTFLGTLDGLMGKGKRGR